MPTTREQRMHSLEAAQKHRLTKAHMRKQLRAGHMDLWPVLVSDYTQQMTVLEVLGLAFVGKGARMARPGRLALEVAAAMPFGVTHHTRLSDLRVPQMQKLYAEFVALAAEEPRSSASAVS